MLWFIIRQLLLLVILSVAWLYALDFMRTEYRENFKKPIAGIYYVNAYTPMVEETGALFYPFHSITKALEYAQQNNVSLIVIGSGIYDEQVAVPDGITLFGDGTVKIARDKEASGSTITVGDNTKLYNLHISGGRDVLTIPYGTATDISKSTFSQGDRYGIYMEKRERPKPEPTLYNEPDPPIYEIKDLTEAEIAGLPLVTFRTIVVKENDRQGLYLRDGRIVLKDSLIVNNGEEGIDLHPHLHATVTNNIASNNGESGLESEIYDNIVLIENNIFDRNIKNGVAFLTSDGTGSIMLYNNAMTNNQKFGLRCAIHRNPPSRPRPFFRTSISRENNTIENNTSQIARECYTF